MNRIKIIILAVVSCFIVACTSSVKKEETSSNLYRILVADKYGFMDEHGRIMIEPQFDDAYTHFSEGVCFVRIGEKRGLIDEAGTFVMEFGDTVRSVSEYVNGLARIDCGDWLFNKVGIINRNGKMVIPSNQYGAWVNVDNNSTYLIVEGHDEENGWFVTNKKGDIIGQTYDSILSGFKNGLCAVKIKEKWGYIDKSGKLSIDTIYDYARVFTKNGIARVRKGNEHCFVDKSGNQLFSVDSTITGFVCNRAAVVMNGEKCFVDSKGKKVFAIDADDVDAFNDEDYLATIIKNGKAAKIDTMGNVVLSTDYEIVGRFINGVAPAKKGNKWGFIDIKGDEIINVANDEYLYDYYSKDSELRAVWNRIDGIWCLSYYDLKGNLIWKDMSNGKKELPWNPEREDFVEYFDARMAELDPIEGIYYVTNKNYYQDRDNPNSIGLNGTKSQFYAIAKDSEIDGFRTYCVDRSNKH